MFVITMNTLTDGRYGIDTLARLKLETSNAAVRKRLQDLAHNHFGEHATHIKGNDGYGYWAHKKTGQTIELELI